MNVITKTRGDVPPFGKPRVVICPHGLYRGGEAELAEDILEAADVAVSYLAGWETVEGAELDRYLEGARLVVCLLDRERLVPLVVNQETFFRAAEARGIPILPILRHNCMGQEQCAENYRRLLGNRQYVSSWLDEYEEELASYFSSLMAEESLRREVEGAFRGRIFLSYRKKDSAEAAKLLHLLHSLPGMEDVAVWIDDYLTPGEDFSDEIREALVGSDAVVLCVTPNLLEMDNYVMRVEYPLARERGIPVLPVVMAEESHALRDRTFQEIFEVSLRHCYPDVGEKGTFRPSRTADLLRALEAILPPPAEKRSAAKTYLLGMGYFFGIQVEADRERALRLLREAAEGGEPRASEQLAELYSGTHGVAYSEEKRICYYQLAADQREAEAFFAHKAGKDTGELFKKAMWDREYLINVLLEGRRSLDAIRQSERMLVFAQAVATDPRIRTYYRATHLRQLGDAEVRLDRYAAAAAHLEKSISLWRELVAEQRNISNRQGLGRALLEYAGLAKLEHRYADALAMAEEAYDLVESVAEDNNHNDRDRVVHALAILTKIYYDMDDWSRTEDLCRRYLREAERLCLQKESFYRRASLQDALQIMAAVCRQRNEAEKAVEYDQRSIELSRALAEETEFVGGQKRLFYAALSLGVSLRGANRVEDAALCYEEAKAAAQKVKEEHGVFGECLYLEAVTKSCYCLHVQGKREELLATFSDAAERFRALLPQVSDLRFLVDFSEITALGAAYLPPEDALALHTEVEELLSRRMEQHADCLNSLLRVIHRKLNVLRKSERKDEALALADGAIARFRPLQKSADAEGYFLMLHGHAADICYERREEEGYALRALGYYRAILAAPKKAEGAGLKVAEVARRVCLLAREADDVSALLLALPHVTGTAEALAEIHEWAMASLLAHGKRREAIRCALSAIDYRETVFRRTMAEEDRAKLASVRAWLAANQAPTVAAPRPQSPQKPQKKKSFWSRLFGGKKK